MNIGYWANVAQLVSVLPLCAAPAVLYTHHRCPDCWRVARRHIGTCHKHRASAAQAAASGQPGPRAGIELRRRQGG